MQISALSYLNQKISISLDNLYVDNQYQNRDLKGDFRPNVLYLLPNVFLKRQKSNHLSPN